MGQTPNEQEWLERATAGDAAALERLLLAHYDPLARLIAQKLPADLRGVVSPEDVLQEACVDAFRGIRAFRPAGPDAFARWLARIAEHRLLDLIKAHRAAKRGGGRAAVTAAPAASGEQSLVCLLDLLAVDEHTPSRSVAGHEAEAAVRAALAKLKPEYAEALRLRYLMGLSVPETAARLGRTDGAVHMLCHRALRELRTAMGGASGYLSTTG